MESMFGGGQFQDFPDEYQGNSRDEMYEDRINDLEARVESVERYVSELRRTIDNIHPVIYNIQEKK